MRGFVFRYEGALDPWMSSLWNMLYQINPKFFPNGPDFVISDTKLINQPKFQITYHEIDKVDLQSSSAPGNSVVWLCIFFLAITITNCLCLILLHFGYGFLLYILVIECHSIARAKVCSECIILFSGGLCTFLCDELENIWWRFCECRKGKKNMFWLIYVCEFAGFSA